MPRQVRTEKTYNDALGRTYKTLYPDNAANLSYYNPLGELWRQVDPDGNSVLFTNLTYLTRCQLVDTNRNGAYDFDGPDRLTKTVTEYANNGIANVRRTTVYVRADNNQEIPVRRRELSTSGLLSWDIVYPTGTTSNPVTTQTETVYGAGGSRTVTVTAPDNTQTVRQYQYGRLQSETRKDGSANHNPLTQATYAYDDQGRLQTLTDARNGASTYSYCADDGLYAVSTPPPGDGQPAQTSFTFRDKLGRATGQLLPDGSSTTNLYDLAGHLKLAYGSRAYAVGYAYDSQGRMTQMTNWSAFSATAAYNGAGLRVTTWKYHDTRGWLEKKDYPDPATGGQPSTPWTNGWVYSYTLGGRLQTRTGAQDLTRSPTRKITTYAYNGVGELASVTYNDGTVSISEIAYDRRGRRSKVTLGASPSSSASFSYNDADQVLAEAYSGGTLNGLSVARTFDSYLRLQDVAAKQGTTTLQGAAYGYSDPSGRLTTVTDGAYSAVYTYAANSSLVDTLTLKYNTTATLTTRRRYDRLNRLQSVQSTPAGATLPVSYGYQYNAANQRTRASLADGSFWLYQYDDLGQVTSGKRYWSDGTPVAGQQFEYGFDETCPVRE